MAYSVNAILHNLKDKNGLYPITIRITCNRKKVYQKTGFKVLAEQFVNGKVVSHPHKIKINATILRQLSQLEEKMIDLFRDNKNPEDNLKFAIEGKKVERILLPDFIRQYADEVRPLRTKATIQVYLALANDIENFDNKLYLDKISLQILNNFTKQQAETWERNTVNKKVKNLKAFLNRAYERQLIAHEQYIALKVPTYVQKIPTYINEEQMAAIKNVCDIVQVPAMKMSGYYFLLSCYAGYRISDLKSFKYENSVKDGKILLTAKKNKEIVSVPIHSRLNEVLQYCRNNPFNIAEQNVRDYVKQLAKLAGIDKDLRIHDGRHSFAMMLMDRGFDLDEVAELLGITPKVAKVYGRISNKRLEEKVLSKLG